MLIAESSPQPTAAATSRTIRKVAVLGSGVMGSRIACHFANIGLDVLLLDIVPRDLTPDESAKGLTLEHPAVRNRIVNASLQAAVKSNPAPLYQADFASRIRTGNFDDDMAKIAESDWIIEVVVERLDVKQQVFEKVEIHRKPRTLVTSNTSGIPIHLMAAGRSEDFRRNFCGTHFFNPPRYLRLLEVIPGPDTDPEVVRFLMHYGDLYLGKKTVQCKDTPAFIANRVGIFAMATIFKLVDELQLTIEEVDLLTGSATGKPKSGTFRLSDVVGLDTTVHVLKGIYDNCVTDESRAMFQPPAYVQGLMEKKWLGDKTGQGFYKKTKTADGQTEILALDLHTMEYRAQQKPNLPAVKDSKNLATLKERMRFFMKGQDKGSQFIRKSALMVSAYVSHRIPEIADALYQIDDAIRAGFGWEAGPFEQWDMIGLAKSVELFAAEGIAIAPWVHDMIAAGHTAFYKVEGGRRWYYDIPTKAYQPVPGAESFIILEHHKDKTIWSNNDAGVIDIGDGVLNVEFRSKMNSIGEGVLRGIHYGIDYAEKHGYNGVVIANDSPDFSVGANLFLIAMMAAEQEWEELDLAVRYFQNTSMRIRTSAVPVVVAPQGRTLGGGCEFTMHADVAVLAAETYIGLVEAGVGLIPGGGGTKEMAIRAADQYQQNGHIGQTLLMNGLMNIAMAKVATSAEEARGLGILRDTDRVVVNLERRIAEAKKAVLELAGRGYVAVQPRKSVKVLGRNALGTFMAGISGLRFGHYASAHDAKVASKVAYVLCGGDLTGEENYVSEQYLLDIEREAFLSLLGERKTLERIQHTLQTGKPLRN